MYSEKYYLGLSLPRILQNEFRNNYNNYSTSASMRHLFLQGGYVFELSQDVKFKPTMLVKAAWGAPVEADITGNFLLRDKVWLGAMLRTFDSYGFIAQWIIDRQLRFGYSIDFTTTRLRNHHSGTHEVMVSYEIGTPAAQVEYPRACSDNMQEKHPLCAHSFAGQPAGDNIELRDQTIQIKYNRCRAGLPILSKEPR
jgi:hypothetical protein